VEKRLIRRQTADQSLLGTAVDPQHFQVESRNKGVRFAEEAHKVETDSRVDKARGGMEHPGITLAMNLF